MKISVRFSRPVPSAIVVVGYIAAFLLLSQALTRGMSLGVAYGIWSAAGIVLVTVVAVVAFDEHITWVQSGGLGLVIVGVLALELGAER